MANQFQRRGPPDRIKTGHDESTKDKIRAEMLSKRLEKYAKARGKQIDKHRMEPAQVQAAKVLIERGKPALQSITQEIHNPMDDLDEDQSFECAKALILSNPSLLKRLREWIQVQASGANETNSSGADAPITQITQNNT